MEYVFEVLAIYVVLELLFPRSRLSWKGQKRGLYFIAVNLLITVLVFSLYPQIADLTVFKPLKVIDLRPLTDSALWPLRVLGFAIAALGGAFIGNFIYYWFHRAQHVLPLLWRFHKVHHSVNNLSAANSYHHFLEDMCEYFLILIPVALLVRLDSSTSIPGWIVFIISTQSYFVHSSVNFKIGPLRYIVGDNHFHRIHHSIEPRHFNKNFGTVTPLYDVLFGTAYFPKKDEWPATGLADTPEPNGAVAFLKMPFES